MMKLGANFQFSNETSINRWENNKKRTKLYKDNNQLHVYIIRSEYSNHSCIVPMFNFLHVNFRNKIILIKLVVRKQTIATIS